MNASRKLLIIRLSSLGDILHTLPAFTAIRTEYPDAAIEWLVSAKCSFLLKAVRGIDKIHVLDTASLIRFPPDRPAWRRFWNLLHELRSRRFDLVLDFQGLLKTAVLGLLSGSGTRFGFSRDLVRERPAHWFYDKRLERPPRPVHVVVLNQMLAELAGASPVPSVTDFSVSAEDCRVVDSLLNQAQMREFAVINPGGGWPTKTWSPERYGALAKRIQAELGIPVAVTTGPGEDGLYRRIAEACDEPPPHHFSVSFLQLIPLLRKARLFIGGDTGPFHLACALGTAVVGIFGPTSPIRNGPWTGGEEVVHHSMDCSSCYGRTCPTKNECMDITVQEVFAGVIRRLRIREDSSSARL